MLALVLVWLVKVVLVRALVIPSVSMDSCVRLCFSVFVWSLVLVWLVKLILVRALAFICVCMVSCACSCACTCVASEIAHFQKEWQTGARIGARSIMGSFGGAVARAKISRSRKST